ncbi:helix-turn-helix transcriptional regulator [Marinomonas arenicola]|uniref:Helix-turn-helix transcriptional regulator n=1 Tax=Marinomonas arenicola TaxID=569601 RepID=A0ABU9G8G4_9GAMM
MQLDAYSSLPTLIHKIGNSDFYSQLIDSIKFINLIESCLVLEYSPNNAPISIISDEALNPDLDNEYCQSAYRLDPFYDVICHGKASGFISLHDLVRQDFERSSYYDKFYHKVGWSNEINFIVGGMNNRTIALSFTMNEVSPSHIDKDLLPFFNSVKAAIHIHESIQEGLLPPRRVQLEQPKDKQIKTTLNQFHLTPREQEITQLILDGHSSNEISSLCFVSEGTVKNHRKSIYRKLGVKSQGDLFKRFIL